MKNRLLQWLPEVARGVAKSVRTHPWLAGATASAFTGTAAVLAGRRSTRLPALPSATAIASTAAAAVHNAAKATVIASVEDDDPGSRDRILAAVRDTVEEAAAAGVDVTSAALGAVEGSMLVAKRLGASELEGAQAAAHEAHTAATRLGLVAGHRVEDALSPLLRPSS